MIKLKDILLESDKLNILIPRRSKEERYEKYLVLIQKEIQDYIKNGSQGNLMLRNFPFSELPSNLTHVGGHLGLVNSKVTKLPENLKIDKSLILDGSPITEIPESISIGHGLGIDKTLITKLPNNITNLGYLAMNQTKVTELPSNLKAIFGDLTASDASLIKLPDDLYIGGELYLHRTPIQRLPDNLTVDGDIKANWTQLSELPRNLVVGKNLELQDTPLAKKYTREQLKQLLPGVKGRIGNV